LNFRIETRSLLCDVVDGVRPTVVTSSIGYCFCFILTMCEPVCVSYIRISCRRGRAVRALSVCATARCLRARPRDRATARILTAQSICATAVARCLCLHMSYRLACALTGIRRRLCTQPCVHNHCVYTQSLAYQNAAAHAVVLARERHWLS
jgi:hypothetical protein